MLRDSRNGPNTLTAGRQLRIFLQGLLDEGDEGIELRTPRLALPRLLGVLEHATHGAVMDAELTCDRADLPLLGVIKPQISVIVSLWTVISPLSCRAPHHVRARMDEHRAEPAADAALEDLGGLLAPEGTCPAARPSRPWHGNTAVLAGQRVMRHFLPADPILQRLTPLPVPIASLARRVFATPRKAVLVAPPGKTLRLSARPLAALSGAVVIAVVAAGAEDDLPMALRAVEQAGVVAHRGGR